MLVICGFALVRKDREVKDLQAAAVAREQEIGARVERLAGEFAGKIAILAEARTADMSRVLSDEREGAERSAGVMESVNVTLTQILGTLAEVRADVRRRSTSGAPPGR